MNKRKQKRYKGRRTILGKKREKKAKKMKRNEKKNG